MFIKKKALAPNYYDEFSCIGSACEDNCCKDWDVDIDKNTYLKYKQIKDADFAREMPERVRRYRGKDVNNGRYARIILDEKNTCKYFREDGLCEIHARFGPGYLSTTCQIYPRFVNFIIEDLPEMSLTMSCPEAARIALFNPEPMTFNLTERDIEVQGTVIKGSTRVVKDPKEGPSYKKHAWSIREGCIDIMQNRKRPINERILFIGIMLNKITEQIQQGDEEGVLGTIQLYVSAFSDSQFDGMMDSFQKSDGMRAAMTSILFNTCVEYMVMRKDSYEPFDFAARYLAEKGVEFKLGESDMTPYLDIDEYIEGHCAVHWAPFMEEYGYVVENYFVNYIFSELFPYKYHEDGLTPYQHFIILAEQYALLRMLLCCNADEKEGVSKAQLTKTITALAHLNQHSQSPKRIIQLYGKSETDSVAHMSFMLR